MRDVTSPSSAESERPSAPNGPAVKWGGVELGPHLPMAVFTSGEYWQAQRVGALTLYCSDGRWGEAFDEFCHRHLHIPRYDRLAVPGGPAWLMPDDPDAAHLYRAAREQLDFLVRAHQLQRLVLITHYGCAFYAERLRRDADGCLPEQVRDTLRAADLLRSWYPDVRVDTFLAMRRGTCLSFHELKG
jgi:hypothetical protein